MNKHHTDRLFFLFKYSPILEATKDKFQASVLSTMDDEYSYYGKQFALQLEMNVNRDQTDNIESSCVPIRVFALVIV